MTIKPLAVSLGVLVLAGLTGQSSVLAFKLWRLNQALTTNLASTNQLVSVEHTMVAKNRVLTSMLHITQSLNGSLATLNQHTGGITNQVAALESMNQATNQAEGSIVTESATAATAAGQVDGQVASLIHSTETLSASLSSLSQVSLAEVQAMQKLLANAKLIEEKTP